MNAKENSVEPTSEFMNFFLKYHILKTNVLTMIIICLTMSIVLLSCGVAVIIRGKSLINIRLPINQQCLFNSCPFIFHVDSPPNGPLFFFIEFEEFFVNNYKVINSIDPTQLKGNTSTDYHVASSCSGYQTISDARRFYPELQAGVSGQQPLNPCGLFPLLYSTCAFIRPDFSLQNWQSDKLDNIKFHQKSVRYSS